MDIEKWLSLGERMGLKDVQLQQYVEKNMKEFLEREKRLMDREDRQREEDEKRRLQEYERAEQLRKEKLREEQIQYEREIELLQMKTQLAQIGAEPKHIETTPGKALRPKLPKFEDDKDDMDAYLERFERFADSQKWPKETWAVSLSSLLTGKGLEVYTSMPPAEASDYDALKTAILKRYQLTEEGFRVKFRDSKPKPSETVVQFMARLRRYFNRWVDMAQIGKTYDELESLLVREQFIKTCSTEMSLFLRERKPKSLDEVTTLAEQYIEAHGGTITSNKSLPQSHSSQTRPPHGKSKDGEQNSRESRPKSCYNCGKSGHFARDCRSKPNKHKVSASCIRTKVENTEDNVILKGTVKGVQSSEASTLPVVSGNCMLDLTDEQRNLDIRTGYIGQYKVNVLRDTGCELAVAKEKYIKPEQYLGKQCLMIPIDGRRMVVEMARIEVDTPYYSGSLDVMVLGTAICDLVLGNIDGISTIARDDWNDKPSVEVVIEENNMSAAVMTRGQLVKEKRAIHPLEVPDQCRTEINMADLKTGQEKDETLAKLRQSAKQNQEMKTRGGNRYRYEIQKGIIYRLYENKRGKITDTVRQIVVPTTQRLRVMSLAHESIVGGHLSVKKTLDRISSSFHWPGISSDVTRFCRSCDICQKTIPKGKITKVPLGDMPIIDTPFHRVAVDLIGPISPVSEKGNRYILTVIDYATRYPEAIALPKIETERVAEALLEVFTRVGFPSEILSDRGSQFTSEMMAEVCRLISIKQLFTTPYNPKCNGLCERMNGVLKSMLKKMCQERPRDWDRYLPAVLFAYREVPQASTGFSPFEMLYGRVVRGPMQILKELWTETETPETRNTYQYVLDLKDRLEKTCEVARTSLEAAQGRYKHHYDKTSRQRSLKAGDKVLVLLPTDHNKLTLQWKGPYEVVEVVNKMDFKVLVGNKIGTYHINLLKKYEERETKLAAAVSVISSECEDSPEDYRPGIVDSENLLEFGQLKGDETYRDVDINPNLTVEQKQDVVRLLKKYKCIFTDRPGSTTIESHDINLTDKTPIRVKQYPLPYATREAVRKEIETMLEAGVIEPACSNYNSPIVLVKKKDGTNRFCVDYRRINSITQFDTEPMGDVEDIMTGLTNDKYFSKLDLAKGYWQIPVEENCRPYTAFSTPDGSYQFRKMPFGMVNSGATFNRAMRKLLHGVEHADNYVDDILGHTVTWDEHLSTLENVFQRTQDAGLTLRPSKCKIGYNNITFTGHVIGNGVMKMEADKVEKVRTAPRPETKTQVRAFLGLAGYYRKFIPAFSDIAAPLTDLTKKGQPNRVIWNPDHERSFNTLKDLLTQAPILRLPDFEKPFVLQCDASDTGVGVALMQEHDDGLFPVAYASKKMLPRERNYSVIEKECLAMVFGIKRFQKYLYGKEFRLQTDHAPLAYIQKCKVESARVMRWALFLQSYKFRIETIRGKDNFCADYLSRQ